jgi:hypothetical protein
MEEKVLLKHLTVLILSFFIAAPALATGEKEWNILVFINGVNDLDDFGAMNINQMEEVGSTNDFNVVVQWGSLASPTVKRLQIKKDNDKKKVTSPVVQDIGKIDMGDPGQLVDFVKWAAAKYPAKHNLVVVWNHGNGWHFNKNFSGKVSALDISYDERTGNSIDTVELGQAMRDITKYLGQKVDIYASDACLMAMIEVADQMADSVNYFVGSQDYEPGEGWSYATLLTRLNAGGGAMPASWVAQSISKDYLAAYSKGGTYGESPVTMSSYDLSKIEPLKDAIRDIKDQLMKLTSVEIKKVNTDSKKTKQFTSDYLDLSDFLKTAAYNRVTTKSTNDYQQAFTDFVIANEQNIDKVSNGISIWLPMSHSDSDPYMSLYKNLSFDRSVGWSQFLSAAVK